MRKFIEIISESTAGNAAFSVESTFTQKSHGENSSPPYSMIVRISVRGQEFDVETDTFATPEAAARSARAFYEAWKATFGKSVIDEDARVATEGLPDGKERIEAALNQLGLHAEDYGVKGVHTNHGQPNKFDAIDGALKALASTKLRHYQTFSVNFRKLQESAHDVIKDIARAAGLNLQIGFQTQARDGSTWQHVDLFDEDHNLVAVAGVRNASRYKDHADFGSYILISVKAEPLEEEPISYEMQGHNNNVPIGSSDNASPEEHSQAVKDAAARVRQKREARALAAAEKKQ